MVPRPGRRRRRERVKQPPRMSPRAAENQCPQTRTPRPEIIPAPKLRQAPRARWQRSIRVQLAADSQLFEGPGEPAQPHDRATLRHIGADNTEIWLPAPL